MAKNNPNAFRLLLFVCGILLLTTSFNVGSVKQIYTSQIGVTEKPIGSNWGPEVKEYLASVGYKIPAPWCAGFVRDVLDSAGIKSTITAFSPTAHNRNNLVYFKGKWLKEVRPGDVFTIYYVSMGRIAHTGFVNRMINSRIVETVEGNTNPGGGREGYGVFVRRRPLKTLYSISRWEEPIKK